MTTDKRDEVELQLAGVADARAFCLKYHPSFLDWLEKECNWVDQQRTPPSYADALLDLLLVCFARMALRNGSQSERPLPYHNENHVMEILHRLHSVVAIKPEHLADWYPLALFAAAHDLRQLEDERLQKPDGCGANEEASWKELFRLNRDLGGLVPEKEMEQLRWMIEGSTFLMGTRSGACQGAWAGQLVQQHSMSESEKERVLLAADLDTANVAEDFFDLAVSSLALAQERLLLKPMKEPGQAMDFMRHFLEQVQWNYFSSCQQFRSRAGRAVFDQRKQRNLHRLRRFINRLKKQAAFDSIEELEQWYIAEAKREMEENIPTV